MDKIRKYGSIAISIYPILSIYATILPGISIGELALLIISIFFLLNKRKIRLYFKEFVIYSIAISFLMCVLHSEYLLATFAFHSVSTVLIIYLISTACVVGDYDRVVVLLKRVCIVCIVFFTIQYVLKMFGSISISGIIPFLPLSNGEDTTSFYDLQKERDRMSSFFEEPAHFSEFLCVPLVLFLYSATRRKDFIICIIITVCIFLSTSALGAVSVVIIWGMWFLNLLKKGNHKWLAVMAIAIMVVTLPILAATELVTSTITRIAEISGDGVENSVHGFSSYIRVLRGYIPFMEQNIIIKLTGNGLGSLDSYIKTHNSEYLSIVAGLPDYINSIQYILIGSGVLGLCLFFWQMYKIYKSTSNVGRTLLLTMFAQMFASGIHSSSVFLLAIFLAIKEERQARTIMIKKT